jgi:hypothetical protein
MADSRGDKVAARLLKRARAAKTVEQREFKQAQREDQALRAMANTNWQSGYTYYGTWQVTTWIGY